MGLDIYIYQSERRLNLNKAVDRKQIYDNHLGPGVRLYGGTRGDYDYLSHLRDYMYITDSGDTDRMNDTFRIHPSALTSYKEYGPDDDYDEVPDFGLEDKGDEEGYFYVVVSQ